ncbi:MAG: ABC transporter substrate-binding protein [Candidatus Thorarchaeota archaeon]
MRRSRSALSLCCIFLVLFLQLPLVVSIDIPEDIRYGPFIDSVVYKVIIGSGTLLALQSGVLDIGRISENYYTQTSELLENPDIDILECPRNGYNSISINCNKYPLNITGFRRAFAFAFNKTKALNYVYEGHATLHDSVVPLTNRLCAEDLLEYHYYEADIERGNAILDELGFTLNSTTGFRDAPNGEPFTVIVYYSPSSSFISGTIAQLACEALSALNVDCYVYYSWWWPWILPPSYDMVVISWTFGYDTMIWEDSLSNYRNDTFTYWTEKYYNGKTYEEVYEASTEIQKILHYNVPRIVVCQPNYLEAIRTDQFQGHIEDHFRYFSGPWTLRRIHRVDGTYGGLFNIGLGQEPYSFNIYVTNLMYSHLILENLYSSLYSRDPNMNPLPDLAISMLTETHSNNSMIPDGHMRYTFDILQNASWSDGQSLTAEDISFTFLYQLESRAYGNPAGSSLNDLVAVYAPSTYRVVFEFSSESYWHFSKIAYDYIIPKHIFTAIGYEGWNTWNPVFDPEEPHVTSGPFVLTDFELGEFYELTVNPLYHWLPQRQPITPDIINTFPPVTSDPIFQIVAMTLSTTYVVVTAGIIVLLIMDRKRSE